MDHFMEDEELFGRDSSHKPQRSDVPFADDNSNIIFWLDLHLMSD